MLRGLEAYKARESRDPATRVLGWEESVWWWETLLNQLRRNGAPASRIEHAEDGLLAARRALADAKALVEDAG